MPDQNFSQLPKPHTTYANIIKSLLPIGEHDKDNNASLPVATYSVDSLQIDHDNLTDYRKICGFANNSYIPPTYFAVLSQSLQMNMMVKEPFPFAMLGLVHIHNSVTQHRPIQDTGVFKMTVSFANLQDHDKGKQFDFITHVYENDVLVWQGVSTYLSRQKKAKTGKKPVQTITKPTLNETDLHQFWQVAEDIGRRYAFISGDFNLIHLHPLSAKAFGFPKAIAHGMWTKAKCLAQLNDLPKAFSCNVDFKSPIFLPSEVEFIAQYDHANPNHANRHIQFGVYDVNSPKPHVIGSVTGFDATQ
ncbi:MaoC-like dehydratase [Moraxella macacae 0408225]|uniref:MaoC-like dehydratase n=1 Tax=Moraxella macacae 0408225 TaxID=1230338 RepID=L2F5M2_9GAMM|nr:MaoC/PaaZ C-terminal domain-containing protein [Moraxella macacae]ELA08364.1 MaoC-like dehydratase [Moraxella macacae 0408225]